jgi:hypothetical protein
MTQETIPPIIVTGLGRSGSTWMQWFLSRHPRIQIHGQSPKIPWRTFWTWCRTMVEQGEWAAAANRRVGYEIAHYAGSPPERAQDVFRRCFRDFLSGFGPSKPRWGLKWIGLCGEAGEVDQFESLWPDARYVVCIRDPFVTITSFGNTFASTLDPRQYALKWVATCEFVESHALGRVVAVQMDKLQERTGPERKAAMHGVMECIGEEACGETDEFLERWEIVHKVTPDAQRSFELSDLDKRTLIEEIPGLAGYMDKYGYSMG